MRWPLVGEFEFFYCEVFDLKNGSKRAFEELQELQIETTRSIGGMTTLIQESVDLAKSSPARKIVDWFVSNQKISIPFALLIVFLLFGRSAIEVVKQAFDLFYGNSE